MRFQAGITDRNCSGGAVHGKVTDYSFFGRVRLLLFRQLLRALGEAFGGAGDGRVFLADEQASDKAGDCEDYCDDDIAHVFGWVEGIAGATLETWCWWLE